MTESGSKLPPDPYAHLEPLSKHRWTRQDWVNHGRPDIDWGANPLAVSFRHLREVVFGRVNALRNDLVSSAQRALNARRILDEASMQLHEAHLTKGKSQVVAEVEFIRKEPELDRVYREVYAGVMFYLPIWALRGLTRIPRTEAS